MKPDASPQSPRETARTGPTDAARMSPIEIAVPRRKLSPLGCMVILGVVAVVAVLGGGVTFLLWQQAGARRITQQLDAIRAKGEPMTPAELNTYYQRPESGSDPTQLWLQGAGALDRPDVRADGKELPIVGTADINTIPSPGRPWPQLEAAAQWLDRNAGAMQALHEAARMRTTARYPLRFEQGFTMLLTHAQSLRDGARALALEARVRAHRGDSRGAAESIRAGWELARSLEQEPVLISQLVAIGTHTMSIETLRDLLPHLDLSDDELRELQESVRSYDFAAGHRRALVGERAIGFEAMSNPARLREAEVTPLPLVGNDDRARYLELMTLFVDSADGSWAERLAISERISDQLKQDAASTVSRVRYLHTVQLLPALDRAVVASARAQANQTIADAALAALRYKRKHGALPRTLMDLVPEFLPAMALDPFDGQPLRMIVGGDSIRFYSIGEDRQDDGGNASGPVGPDQVFDVR